MSVMSDAVDDIASFDEETANTGCGSSGQSLIGDGDTNDNPSRASVGEDTVQKQTVVDADSKKDRIGFNPPEQTGVKPCTSTSKQNGLKPCSTSTNPPEQNGAKPCSTSTNPTEQNGAKPSSTSTNPPEPENGTKPCSTSSNPFEQNGTKPCSTGTNPHGHNGTKPCSTSSNPSSQGGVNLCSTSINPSEQNGVKSYSKSTNPSEHTGAKPCFTSTNPSEQNATKPCSTSTNSLQQTGAKPCSIRTNPPDQSGVRPSSTSKQRHDPMSSPRQTRASQLRIKSHSVSSETNSSPARAAFGRQTSLRNDQKAAAASTPRPLTVPSSSGRDAAATRQQHRPLSRSTSSEDGSENTESVSSDRGSEGSCAGESHHQHITNTPTSPSAKTQPQLPKGGGGSSNLTPLARESIPEPSQQNKTASHTHPSLYGQTERYLTPLQQKERQNRELTAHVAKLEQTVLNLHGRVQQFEDEKEQALDELRGVKDVESGKLLIEIKKLQMQLRQGEESIEELNESLRDERNTTASLKEEIETMKKEQEERETMHQQRYLDMYQKGREAQLIEQEEDLMCMAIAAAPGGDGKTKRLVKKLEQTEKELEKLRQTFREDVYNKSPALDTDSAAQVELLKSAVYYYLTDTQPDVNLTAMLSMLNYSDVQKRNIRGHLKKKSK